MTEKPETVETLSARLPSFLRASCSHRETGVYPTCEPRQPGSCGYCAAADEIERLEASVREANRQRDNMLAENHEAVRALEIRNRQLREAEATETRLRAELDAARGVYGSSLAKDLLEATLIRAEQAETASAALRARVEELEAPLSEAALKKEIAMDSQMLRDAIAMTSRPPGEVRHGNDCQKVNHVVGPRYLHDASDDRPYFVDGLTYCGRCHHWLPEDVARAIVIESLPAPCPVCGARWSCAHEDDRREKSSSDSGPKVSDRRQEVSGGELSVLEWAKERRENSIRIASGKSGADRLSWAEDVAYWTEIVRRLEILENA